jgi:Flp pilus assembly protein TadG
VGIFSAKDVFGRAGSAVHRLRHNQSGAVMLEFAFVAIPFIAVILASLYTSLIFFTGEALNTSNQKAARLMITGTSQKASTTQAAYKAQVCETLPKYMKCDRLFIDVRKASTFASLDTSIPTINIDSSGNVTNAGNYQTIGKGEIGMVRLIYVWYAGSGPNGLDLSNTTGGNRTLMTTSVFMAEPYGS